MKLQQENFTGDVHIERIKKLVKTPEMIKRHFKTIGYKVTVDGVGIVNGEQQRIYGVGFSKCHASDKFCKQTGRATALFRALPQGTDYRPVRKAVWNALRNAPVKVGYPAQ